MDHVAIMHEDAVYPPETLVLLDSLSPYGSRRVTVECDGEATAAYLRDERSILAAAWIANHRSAPATTEQHRLASGLVPLMPAGNTTRPRGRSRPNPDTLEAVWFEEGDGVAILERGALLAVLPGWSDASRGMPGYSKDIIGQTPFGWSLDDAIEGLEPRMRRARAFWHWRESAGGWRRSRTSPTGSARPGTTGTLAGAPSPWWASPNGRPPPVGRTPCSRPSA
jgi:hypothetical protein